MTPIIFVLALLVLCICAFWWYKHRQERPYAALCGCCVSFVLAVYTGANILTFLLPSHTRGMIQLIYYVAAFCSLVVYLAQYFRVWGRIRPLPFAALGLLLVVCVILSGLSAHKWLTHLEQTKNPKMDAAEQFAKQQAVHDLEISRWDITDCYVGYPEDNTSEDAYAVAIYYSTGTGDMVCVYDIAVNENGNCTVLRANHSMG